MLAEIGRRKAQLGQLMTGLNDCIEAKWLKSNFFFGGLKQRNFDWLRLKKASPYFDLSSRIIFIIIPAYTKKNDAIPHVSISVVWAKRNVTQQSQFTDAAMLINQQRIFFCFGYHFVRGVKIYYK